MQDYSQFSLDKSMIEHLTEQQHDLPDTQIAPLHCDWRPDAPISRRLAPPKPTVRSAKNVRFLRLHTPQSLGLEQG
jgi:hypothetical protein